MFKNVIEKLNRAECVGIFTHTNPDGDALGSAYSLKNVLTDMDKRAEVYLCGGIENSVFELVLANENPEISVDECDMLIALDCADIERLADWKDVFASHENTAAIDHHITHKAFAKETVVADVSSTCEIMYTLYREMNAKISLEAATDLYIGIATDTGNFKYSSVTGDTHRVAAELIEMGVPFADISKKLFDTVSKEYLALFSRAASKIEFYFGGKVAILCLNDADFEECGIDEASASAIVTMPGNIKGAEVGVYVRQRGEQEYKVSLRSAKYVDVSKLAQGFGGGGHIRAAGYSVKAESVDENIRELLARLERELA